MSKIPKPEIEQIRTELLALRARLTGDVSHLKHEALRTDDSAGAGSESSMPTHLADIGSDSFEQELSLSLLQNEEQTLEEIADALDRLTQGTFGTCEECQHPIARPRLQALPYARHCVECARKLQQSK